MRSSWRVASSRLGPKASYFDPPSGSNLPPRKSISSHPHQPPPTHAGLHISPNAALSLHASLDLSGSARRPRYTPRNQQCHVATRRNSAQIIFWASYNYNAPTSLTNIPSDPHSLPRTPCRRLTPPPLPQATKAKISDAQSRVETLRSEEARNAESIRQNQRARADAALKV